MYILLYILGSYTTISMKASINRVSEPSFKLRKKDCVENVQLQVVNGCFLIFHPEKCIFLLCYYLFRKLHSSKLRLRLLREICIKCLWMCVVGKNLQTLSIVQFDPVNVLRLGRIWRSTVIA